MGDEVTTKVDDSRRLRFAGKMSTIPKISEENIQDFTDEEKELLRKIPDEEIEEEEFKKLETFSCLPVAIRGFEHCFFDEKYPYETDIDSGIARDCNSSFEHMLRVLRDLKKDKKKPGTQFSEQLLQLLFKLLEFDREVVVRPLEELVYYSEDIISLKGIEDIFSQQYMPKVIEILKEADTSDFKKDDYSKAKTMKRFMDDCIIGNIEFVKGKLSKDLLTYILACFEKMTNEKLQHMEKIFREKGIKWKNHIDGAVELLKHFKVIRPYREVRWESEKGEEDYDEEDEDYMDDWSHPYRKYKDLLKDVMGEFCENLENLKVLSKPEIQKGLADLLLSSIQGYNRLYCAMADPIPDKINNWKDVETVIPDILEAINKCLKVDNFKIFEGPWYNQKRLYTATLSSLCPYIKDNNPEKYSEILYSIFNFCMEQDLENDEDNHPLSIHGDIVQVIINSYVMQNPKKEAYQKFVPHIIEITKKDIEILTDSATSCIMVMQTNKGFVQEDIFGVIDSFCSTGNTQLLGSISQAFNGESETKVMEKFDDILAVEISENDPLIYAKYELLSSVSKKYPKRAMKYKDVLTKGLDNTSGALTFALMGLVELTGHEPSKFTDLIDKIDKLAKSEPHYIYYIDGVLANIAISNEKESKRIMPILMRHLKEAGSDQKSSVLMSIKTVATKQKDVVLAFKEEIEKFRDTPGVVSINDMIQSIVDVLEDRSLATVSQKVDENKEDIDQLDERVTNTEEDVKELDTKVDNQQKDLDTVKEDVREQEERLDDLEEVVDDTIEKVEEIDHKTISSAPAWSRDVSLLLNPESDSDWRFIAIRLGYSPEDVRNWATAHDPTMSMLSEWYTTHKSTDATYAVLTSLKELGRNDCADIIEKALKDADQAVPGPPPEMTHPPPIFISYQWDHQSEVKAIRQHLEMAGYECWLDIGQMGGGDKLYEKIDEGMRGAKVVLSMCTSKYAQSKNCNHEVNLASLLNKPIIPIILEDMPWPPPGAMSMLFSQLLYIDFKSDQEAKVGEKFWTDAKFSELLGQITYYVAPDPEKIADEYKDWVPKVEEPTPKPKKKTDSNIPETKSATEPAQEPEVSDPEVFISYQWGKQTEVKKLYGKLVDLGFTCWLDINQMGGGDALYMKIDRGVRKAKVVVSCVTPKYALSANCRREVSLSDALRKPMIPILLEEISWPPEGPMSMPFAQLLYIDFTKEISQKFADEKFEELLNKIQEYSKPINKESRMVNQNSVSVPASEQPTASVESLGSDQESRQDNKKNNQPNSPNLTNNQNKNSTPTIPVSSHANNNQPKELPVTTKKSKTCNIL